MTDWAPNVAGRLEEIDRRLREIQAELVPGRVPRETRVPEQAWDQVSASQSDAVPPASESESDAAPPATESETDTGLREGGNGPGAAPGPPTATAESVSGLSADQGDQGPASPGTSDDPPGLTSGRSGPLAEALQRARSARIADLTTPQPPPAPAGAASVAAEPPPAPAGAPPVAAEAPPASAGPAPEAGVPHPENSVDEHAAAGVAPDPAPSQARPEPSPPLVQQALRAAIPRSDPRVDVLTELQSSLLTATRDLLDGYERASFTASERQGNRVTISAGPFAGTESLHSFEQELSRIPGVRGVGVRGYEGSDRAIIEVELEEPPGR